MSDVGKAIFAKAKIVFHEGCRYAYTVYSNISCKTNVQVYLTHPYCAKYIVLNSFTV